ncbi:transcriptional regulator [Ralstonia sp.]|uniref:transcriptional regulator n=1 Tax=Ralstonia sp. TaxID=54061 RepID=UPI002D14A016|nr:YdaS family helix-turn-helix protein [Ralstonia sp.]HWV04978.1 YdaS family helix-turn-helix protein [Ralstonia sp.]
MAMTLTEYVRARRGRMTALARAIDMSPIYLSQIVNKGLRINPTRCVAIEMATQGVVRRPDLRPDDWHLIWPELVSARAPSAWRHQRSKRLKPRMIPAAAPMARLRCIRRWGCFHTRDRAFPTMRRVYAPARTAGSAMRTAAL